MKYSRVRTIAAETYNNYNPAPKACLSLNYNPNLIPKPS